jgi:group II intron reverse transcriptase/maturase
MAVHSTDREPWNTALYRIGVRAHHHPETVFNNLGHLITEELLHASFQGLSGNKAVGIDKVDKKAYEERLHPNLNRLLTLIRKGQYKPQASRIVEIPKEDGSTRPLAISCLEDKIVQGAVNIILTTIYEPMFLPCSYGFRPNRNCHDALRSLSKAAYAFTDGAIVEIDIRKCFNMIPHDHLMTFLEKKISDTRFLALIKVLITAPVIEAGKSTPTQRGCPQGSIISPVLANIYLHYVIDEWFKAVSITHLRGKAELIRYADDMVFVFQNPEDSRRIFDVLGKRLGKYGLALHEEKSGLMLSGTHAAKRAAVEGKRMPTFYFLGFLCYWGKARSGQFWRLKYKSRADRFTVSLKRIKEYLRENLTTSSTIETLEGVVRRVKGWINYHAISDNQQRVSAYLHETRRIVYIWFNRRGSKRTLKWENLDHWLNRVKFPRTYKTISMLGNAEGC